MELENGGIQDTFCFCDGDCLLDFSRWRGRDDLPRWCDGNCHGILLRIEKSIIGEDGKDHDGKRIGGSILKAVTRRLL